MCLMTTKPGSFCENEVSLPPAKATCPSMEVDMKESLQIDDRLRMKSQKDACIPFF